MTHFVMRVGHEGCERHQAIVAAAPSAIGVAPTPNSVSVRDQSVARGSANFCQVSFSSRNIGTTTPPTVIAMRGIADTLA